MLDELLPDDELLKRLLLLEELPLLVLPTFEFVALLLLLDDERVPVDTLFDDDELRVGAVY